MGICFWFYGVKQSKSWDIICQENKCVDPELSKGVFMGGGHLNSVISTMSDYHRQGYSTMTRDCAVEIV